MRKQFAVTILLALLIVFPLLAGCAGGSGQPDTGTASVTQADSPSSDVQAHKLSTIASISSIHKIFLYILSCLRSC